VTASSPLTPWTRQSCPSASSATRVTKASAGRGPS
jgi:hypothetical protein